MRFCGYGDGGLAVVSLLEFELVELLRASVLALVMRLGLVPLSAVLDLQLA
jgi:hypothetical protein